MAPASRRWGGWELQYAVVRPTIAYLTPMYVPPNPCRRAADPRVDTRDNEGFLDLMERYFAQVRDRGQVALRVARHIVPALAFGVHSWLAEPLARGGMGLLSRAFSIRTRCTPPLCHQRAVSLQPLEQKMADVRPELAYQVKRLAFCCFNLG